MSPFLKHLRSPSAAVLTEFLSLDDITYASVEDLVNFICLKGKNRFSNPLATVNLLKKAARDSYRLDKVLYEPLNVTIASSFNVVKFFASEIKSVDEAIIKAIKGLNTNEYQSLDSIPGIGPVFASGILAEIGTIKTFSSNDALAKFSGITWRQTGSGNFKADNTRMTKTGNKYLRYYLIEAANSVRKQIPKYKAFYLKKYNEVTTHSHKRALALTSRKLIRLIFALLSKDQLYSDKRVGNSLIK
ncbi:MAG: transposase [Alkaliphilus sp.]